MKEGAEGRREVGEYGKLRIGEMREVRDGMS